MTPGYPPDPVRLLDMTVCCRSNDVVWGAYGANAVHFSVLQEYMAARIGVAVGTYTQFSNNFHVYTNVLDKLDDEPHFDATYHHDKSTGVRVLSLVASPDKFDLDLQMFMSGTPADSGLYCNPFFPIVAIPMKEAYRLWRSKNKEVALEMIQSMPERNDWRVATEAWMKRRMGKGVAEKSEEGVAR